MAPKIISVVPPGAYVLDCSPFGPPVLLRVDPAKLTPEQRKAVCAGVPTFELHTELKLESAGDNNFKIGEIKQ